MDPLTARFIHVLPNRSELIHRFLPSSSKLVMIDFLFGKQERQKNMLLTSRQSFQLDKARMKILICDRGCTLVMRPIK